MAKTDPTPEPDPAAEALDTLNKNRVALTDDERAELDALREKNAAMRQELDEIDDMARPRTLTTDAEPIDDTERRRRLAEHERAVMDRSEGARIDREQRDNAERHDPALKVARLRDEARRGVTTDDSAALSPPR
jgi:hypothetical protein